MGLVSWIVTGFVAGLLARGATGVRNMGCLFTTIVGILGGLIGGALFAAAGQTGIEEFNLWAILVAFAGATLLLLVLRGVGAVTRR